MNDNVVNINSTTATEDLYGFIKESGGRLVDILENDGPLTKHHLMAAFLGGVMEASTTTAVAAKGKVTHALMAEMSEGIKALASKEILSIADIEKE